MEENIDIEIITSPISVAPECLKVCNNKMLDETQGMFEGIEVDKDTTIKKTINNTEDEDDEDTAKKQIIDQQWLIHKRATLKAKIKRYNKALSHLDKGDIDEMDKKQLDRLDADIKATFKLNSSIMLFRRGFLKAMNFTEKVIVENTVCKAQGLSYIMSTNPEIIDNVDELAFKYMPDLMDNAEPEQRLGATMIMVLTELHLANTESMNKTKNLDEEVEEEELEGEKQ
jgi:hypothetical protein